MSTIRIKNSSNEEDTLLFPVTPAFSLNDLRSAFPLAHSLRYKDNADDEQHHVVCREGFFQTPEDGWNKQGRVYLAVCGLHNTRGVDRQSQFEVFRRHITSRQQTSTSIPRSSSLDRNATHRIHRVRSESPTTMVYVGHGHFRNGIFSKISETNLSLAGGVVTVGPFSKTENNPNKIKEEAFKKFKDQNQLFRRRFKSADEFVLVYKDGTEVKRLPDNSAVFTLKGYRDYLDPKRRFDRLRFYLCHRDNFYENDIQIITDESSDDDLPAIDFPVSSKIDNDSDHSASPVIEETRSSTPSLEDETVISCDGPSLITDCVFHMRDRVFTRPFPNNARTEVLYVFISQHISSEYNLVVDGHVIPRNSRLMELCGNSNILNIDVQESQTEDAHPKENIPADYEVDTKSVVQKVVTEALESIGTAEEPTLVLRTYRNLFLDGRPLEVGSNITVSGETSEIFIGRNSVWEDCISETSNLANIRFPLQVQFYGEEAEDYGGPRREFFRLFMEQVKQRMIEVNDDKCRLLKRSNFIANHAYYIVGILIGLSALENGPCADFLDNLLFNWKVGEEEYEMFKAGLERTGLWQMITTKPTLRFLFRNRVGKLTVSRLLALMKPVFSTSGSSKRQDEEKTYSMFVKYIRQIAAGRLEGVTLQMVLQFATGSSEEPILGFDPEPSIGFSELPGSLPTASTCINRLDLPLATHLTEEQMFEKFSLSFTSQYFGLN